MVIFSISFHYCQWLALNDSELLKIIGLRIKKVREELGISQTLLANSMGKDQQWLQRIEKGNTNITIKSLNLISSSLKVEISKFLEA